MITSTETRKLIESLGKAGAAVILSAGLIAIFGYYMYKQIEMQEKDQGHQQLTDKFIQQHTERQTAALEGIMETYTGK